MGYNTSCDTTESWKKYILGSNQTIMLEKHLGIDTSMKGMRIIMMTMMTVIMMIMKMMIDDDGKH